MKLLKQFIQQETVLTAAAVLAVVSAFFALPDAQYLGYIDLRTRQNKEGGGNGQHSGCGEDRFLLNELFE